MFRMLTALVVVALLTTAVAASASVTIGSPRDGDVVGPSTPIYGQCSQRAFVVVITDVLSAAGEKIGQVPGIRHWTNDDNSISVRIATPRISFGEKGEAVTYVIHVKAYSTPQMAQEDEAPDVGEAKVTVKSE
jgi:hypothetical protein